MSVKTTKDVNNLLKTSDKDLKDFCFNNQSKDFYHLQKLLNLTCSFMILEYFKQSSVKINHDDTISLNELFSKLKVVPQYKKFINYFLSILKEDNIVDIKNDEIKFIDTKSKIPKIDDLFIRLFDSHPSHKNFYILLQCCFNSYVKVLRGETSALEILYPDGTLNFLENGLKERVLEFDVFDFYKKFIIDFFNLIANEKKIDILEVGGGSGMVTWDLIKNIKENISSYYFTDISRAFLLKAKSHAKNQDYSFLKYEKFDITREPREQNFEDQSFNVILAVNVVHSVPKVDETILFLKRLLKKGGYLVLLETFYLPRWSHFIWGLTAGWWCFNDSWRHSIPLVNGETWTQIFNHCGLKQIHIFSSDVEMQKSTNYGVIIAENV